MRLRTAMLAPLPAPTVTSSNDICLLCVSVRVAQAARLAIDHDGPNCGTSAGISRSCLFPGETVRDKTLHVLQHSNVVVDTLIADQPVGVIRTTGAAFGK